MTMVNVWLVLLTLGCLHVNRYEMGNQYCSFGYTPEIKLRAGHFEEHYLVPSAVDGRVLSECKWNLTVANFAKLPRQLVLQGTLSEHESDTPSSGRSYKQSGDYMEYQLYQQNSTVRTTVHYGMFHVLQVTKSEAHLSVSYTKMSLESHGSHPVILRVLLPLPGFYSRDMVSFHGNCLAVSQVRGNITDAMSNIRGHAQLASFNSMAEINEFIAANNARLELHPYKRPLDLSQAVRIGMFYSATDATILSVVRNESGCSELRPLERPQEFRQSHENGSCASLRVDESGRAVIEFDDCSDLIPSLISFPEAPKYPSVSSLNCKNNQVEALLRSTGSSTDNKKLNGAASESKFRWSELHWTFHLIFFFILIVAVPALIIKVVHMWQRKSQRRRNLLEDAEASAEQSALG